MSRFNITANLIIQTIMKAKAKKVIIVCLFALGAVALVQSVSHDDVSSPAPTQQIAILP